MAQFFFTVSSRPAVAKYLAEHISCLVVRFGDEVCIDVQRGAGIAVAEATRHRPHIDARRQQSRRDVVPEIMQPDPLHAGLLAQAAKGSRGRIRSPREAAIDGLAEDERVRAEGGSRQGSRLRHSVVVFGESLHRRGVEW